jgi:hypothetical protein
MSKIFTVVREPAVLVCEVNVIIFNRAVGGNRFYMDQHDYQTNACNIAMTEVVGGIEAPKVPGQVFLSSAFL